MTTRFVWIPVPRVREGMAIRATRLLDPRVRGDDGQRRGDDEVVLGSSGFPPSWE